MTEYAKNFERWHAIKAGLNNKENPPTIREREIWWCSIGVNVGHEEDGKGEIYSRPVLVVRKFNKHVFLGVPLTTQVKERWHYHRIHLHGREQCIMLTQLRLLDSKRLSSKLGKLSHIQFESVKAALKDMI